MQQEDDLRGLAKIMEFMRAVSIILVVMNVYRSEEHTSELQSR